MTQKNLDQLLFERDIYYKYLDRARELALKAVLLEAEKNIDSSPKKKIRLEKLKNSARGNYQEYQNLTNKIDRISNHLYGKCWAVVSTSTCYQEKVEERRNLELSQKKIKYE